MLARVDEGVDRPLIVTGVYQVPVGRVLVEEDQRLEWRVSGTIVCEAEDHTRPVFRGAADRPHDPARFSGRPDRMLPFGYAECLAHGTKLGQWRKKP